MVALRHKGRPDERPLDVPEDAVESWSRFGYVPVEDEKTTAKRPARSTRKTASKSADK